MSEASGASPRTRLWPALDTRVLRNDCQTPTSELKRPRLGTSKDVPAAPAAGQRRPGQGRQLPVQEAGGAR